MNTHKKARARRIRQISAVAAVLLLVLIAVVVSSSRQGPAPSGATRDPGMIALVRKGVEQLTLEGTSRRPPFVVSGSAPERIPRIERRAIRDITSGTPEFRLRLNDAQFIPTSVDRGLWLVEGRGVTCLFVAATAASSCSTTAESRRLGLLVATFRTDRDSQPPSRTFSLMGIGPNWARAALVAVGSDIRTIQLRSQGFAIRADRPIVLREFRASA